MYLLKKIFVLLVIILSICFGQIFTQADPFYLMQAERNSFLVSTETKQPFLIRPFLNNLEDSFIGAWSIGFRTELFLNDNAPNLENTSDKWIGKGSSFFQGLNIQYQNRFVALSFEPFYFTNQNKEYSESWQDYFSSLPDSVKPYRLDQPYRERKFSNLNDMRPHLDIPYKSSGFREAQIYLHYNGLGIGYSNANMWWGQGYHSSLNMTNNTTGFPHLMIGTIKEQRYKDFSFNFRYIFADSLQSNAAKPFYTAILSSLTYYSEPIITFGFSRAYLTGGQRTIEVISKRDAMLIPFEALYLKDKPVDIWDQTLVGYLSATFPESGLTVFVEYGRNDHAWDKDDLIRQPDHTAASIIGLRKYGFFNNPNLVGGVEYTNLIRTKFWHYRSHADWYDRGVFDYWGYDGRYWGAHSGPDSDDFYAYFGYMSDKLTIIPSFNYERHGIIDNKIPEREYEVSPVLHPHVNFDGNGRIWSEIKIEYHIDLRYKYNDFLFNLYYEREIIHNDQMRAHMNSAFIERKSNVFWFGVERRFNTNEISYLVNRYILKK